MFNRSLLRRRRIGNTPQSLLTRSDAGANDAFAISVALSGDGNTVIGGSYGDNSAAGTATVFTRSGRTWTQQQTISKTGAAAGDWFGWSVALSNDGNTAIVGAHEDISRAGSATVFTRSAGVWTQQQELTKTGAVAGDFFGWSVALSSDGDTAIVGAPQSGSLAGSATVFTRSAGVWTQQQILTQTGSGPSARFGRSVSLSSDGNTAVGGAPEDTVSGRTSQGTATVFTRSAGVWTQQKILSESAGVAQDRLGTSVDLSSDGNTLIAGTEVSEKVVFFTRSAGVWSQQQAISLTNSGFGFSVALSSSGNTAIIGAFADTVGGVITGSAIVFRRSGGVWKQQQILSQSAGAFSDQFGYSVSLSADGNTAIGGAWGANVNVGNATVFYNH